MPRPTLKLPGKPAASDAADGPRARPRKPLRGNSALAKHAASWRSEQPPAAAATPRASAGKANREAGKVPPVKGGPAAASAPARNKTGKELPATSTQPVKGVATAAPANSAPSDRQSERRIVEHPREDAREPAADGRVAAGRPVRSSTRSYPPRGIARSTGARAAPPAPQRPAAAGVVRTATQDGPPAARPAEPLPTRRQPEVANVSNGMPRGLAKESPRLSKLVSQLAQCSRREADEWIENGWVSVDGVAVNRLGARVSPKARIMIKEVARKQAAESVTIVFHQPREEANAAIEKGRPAVAASIRADNRWCEDNTAYSFQASHLRGLALAGKLDGDEGGMLAFTQEGSVARRLTGRDSRLEKEYHVRVEGELAADGLELLRHGLSLDNVKLPKIQVSWLSEQQMRFVMHDARPGQIRRMCELVGLQVTDIKRVRIGSVSLGKLPPGQWRYLRDDERF
ncbi:MAG: pseudouridine synthase [Rhodobacteraceae bacterium]|nr:pseudouridine synthase [Paracoccaceae bacterium]